MFSKLDVLNAFSTHDIYNLNVGAEPHCKSRSIYWQAWQLLFDPISNYSVAHKSSRFAWWLKWISTALIKSLKCSTFSLIVSANDKIVTKVAIEIQMILFLITNTRLDQ